MEKMGAFFFSDDEKKKISKKRVPFRTPKGVKKTNRNTHTKTTSFVPFVLGVKRRTKSPKDDDDDDDDDDGRRRRPGPGRPHESERHRTAAERVADDHPDAPIGKRRSIERRASVLLHLRHAERERRQLRARRTLADEQLERGRVVV